ncbi:hypothetical protein DM81_3435 [Burkholderia multivorans]|uniref:DUF551 domain-containing protein n=1 Tax=Burkholderia multivorans TaxID=87883 RepID=UPI00050F5D53|nr:DUF551 domain-containing protein [Burkholderia multivorans]KGC02943.1 hypothetical protein DM81_3435 [Burkholderia multivorans]
MTSKLTDEQIEAAKAAGFYWHPVQKCLCTRHSSGAWVAVDDMLARFVALLAPTQQPSGEVTDTAWISVDERLPKFDRKAGSFGTEVLIWPPMESGERTAFFGRRVSTKPSFYRYGAPVYGVTHWMPLPDAPADAARAQGGES